MSSQKGYDRNAAMKFVATYANASCSKPSHSGYLASLDDLLIITDEAFPRRVERIFDKAKLSPYQRELVEARYGLRNGKSSIGAKLDGDIRVAIEQLDAWAFRERFGRRAA